MNCRIFNQCFSWKLGDCQSFARAAHWVIVSRRKLGENWDGNWRLGSWSTRGEKPNIITTSTYRRVQKLPYTLVASPTSPYNSKSNAHPTKPSPGFSFSAFFSQGDHFLFPFPSFLYSDSPSPPLPHMYESHLTFRNRILTTMMMMCIWNRFRTSEDLTRKRSGISNLSSPYISIPTDLRESRQTGFHTRQGKYTAWEAIILSICMLQIHPNSKHLLQIRRHEGVEVKVPEIERDARRREHKDCVRRVCWATDMRLKLVEAKAILDKIGGVLVFWYCVHSFQHCYPFPPTTTKGKSWARRKQCSTNHPGSLPFFVMCVSSKARMTHHTNGRWWYGGIITHPAARTIFSYRQ